MNLRRLGKYEILARIGQGAMGEVFRAHDPIIGRDVAIKLMSGAADDDELQRRFRREAQSAGRLNHPNIVTIYDFGQEEGRTFIAMELLEGRDLKQRMAQAPPLSLPEKLDLMQQICDGLAFAHSKDVIHRDLKPANVHLSPSGLVKIMDFGLAKDTASDITGTGMIMGTLHYMSPEQMRGEKATACSDVFSLGALFYELLSHRKPFGGDSLHAILFQVMQGEPEPLRRVAPDAPPALRAVVERALQKDPAQRFPDAQAMAQALREARAGGRSAAPARPAAALADKTWLVPAADPEATPYSTTVLMRDDAVRPGRSRAAPLAAAAGALVVLSAAGLVAYRLPRSEDRVEQPSPAVRPSPPPSVAAVVPTPAPIPTPAATPAPTPKPRAEPSARAGREPAPAPAPSSRAGRGGPAPSATPSRARVVAAASTPTPSPSIPPPPPPSSAPTPVPPAAPSEAAAVQEIHGVLSRYRAAFAALDLAGLKAVYPGLDERATRQLFDSATRFEVALKVERIDVSGLVATAECLGTYNPFPKPRGPRARPLRQLFELTWNGESWRITRVRTRL